MTSEDIKHQLNNSPFVPALSNEAGAGQFMTDFLPLTAWSQVPPVSLSISLCA